MTPEEALSHSWLSREEAKIARRRLEHERERALRSAGSSATTLKVLSQPRAPTAEPTPTTTRENTPHECGLGRFCNTETAIGCIGRDALLRVAREGPTKQVRAKLEDVLEAVERMVRGRETWEDVQKRLPAFEGKVEEEKE